MAAKFFNNIELNNRKWVENNCYIPVKIIAGWSKYIVNLLILFLSDIIEQIILIISYLEWVHYDLFFQFPFPSFLFTASNTDNFFVKKCALSIVDITYKIKSFWHFIFIYSCSVILCQQLYIFSCNFDDIKKFFTEIHFLLNIILSYVKAVYVKNRLCIYNR